MILLEVINIRNFLAKLELSKFDKEVRKAVRKNYVLASKKVTDYQDARNAFREKCFEGIDDEIIQKATALEQEFEIAKADRKSEIEKELLSEKFQDYQVANKEFIELLEEELKKDVEEIDWVKVDEDAIMDSFAAAGIRFTATLSDDLKYMIKVDN